MSNYVLATDSCCDLPYELVKELNLEVIPLSVEIKGKVYHNYPDERYIKTKDFYEMMREKEVATTSLINVGEFLVFFEPFLKKGKDILYVGFSSALSGTVQSARIAAEELKLTYPDRKIMVVDSLSASMGQGLLVWYVAKRVKAGKPIEEVEAWVENNRLELCHLFTVDDLGTLRRGGRLSGTAALLGSLLKVKPVLHVSDEGKLIPVKKARGRKTSLQVIVDLMKEKIKDPESQTVFISHGDDLEDANYIKGLISEQLGVKEFVIGQIGPVIGAHSGPGTIAVFFLGNPR